MKTVRRPPYPKWNPGYFPCSSLTPPSAFLTPSIGVLRWIRGKKELAEVKMERDILKKAAAYFAKESLPGTRR